jgi:hypothetical protein
MGNISLEETIFVEEADLSISNDIGGVIAHGLGDTKINDLEGAIHKHEIAGLQVEVEYLFYMAHLDTLQDFPPNIADRVFVQLFLRL